MLDGEYGVKGLFVGVLCKLGGNGLEKVVELKLNDEERKGLDNSIKAVEELLAALKKLEF
jgi:malate dehydrogenase